MILQSSASASFDFSLLFCPCGRNLDEHQQIPTTTYNNFKPRNHHLLVAGFSHRSFRQKWGFHFQTLRAVSSDRSNLSPKIAKSARKGAKALVVKRVSDELDGGEELSGRESTIQMGSNFANFQEDPIVDKLRTQLGVIHPIPSPPLNRNVVGLFVFFFFVGVAFDKLWTSRKRGKTEGGRIGQAWPQVPTSFSLFLEKDLQRKESVEWVNMVLGKLWKVYRGGIENWIIGLLQPVIDNLEKPDYVQRVEIKQFSLGDDPLSVRNVERRTSRRVNDLQ